jgi:hypothetical protein
MLCNPAAILSQKTTIARDWLRENTTLLFFQVRKKSKSGGKEYRDGEAMLAGMPEYCGEKRTVVIDDKSPPVIDLGVIELKPVQ